MNVPKYIITKMYRANAQISEGNSLISEIRRYFEEKGATEEALEEIDSTLDFPHNEGEIENLIELLKGE